MRFHTNSITLKSNAAQDMHKTTFHPSGWISCKLLAILCISLVGCTRKINNGQQQKAKNMESLDKAMEVWRKRLLKQTHTHTTRQKQNKKGKRATICAHDNISCTTSGQPRNSISLCCCNCSCRNFIHRFHSIGGTSINHNEDYAIDHWGI